MTYYVYESYPHNKAVIHRGDCAYCRDGTDRQGTRSLRDGSWLGPFDTHRSALLSAAETKRRRQSNCRHCMEAATPAAASTTR